MRRRMFLVAAGLAPVGWPASAAAADADPAGQLTRTFSELLFGPATSAEPLDIPALRAALTVAEREFASCQYVPLANRLRELIAAAESAGADRVLAQAYNLATRVLGKLDVSGLQWLTADRGLRAARAAEDPLLTAESQRLMANVARRAGHHDQAQTLTLAAAEDLDRSQDEHLAVYGMLLCSAGYAAAGAGNRDAANDLFKEADATSARLPGNRELAANVVSYRVSAANALGDAGSALAHAKALPLAAIPTTERRARLLVDVATSYHQWGKPDRAYSTLLAAERTAPTEVRTRSAVRRLVDDLMRAPNQAAMPGLSALAGRVRG